MLLKIGCCNRMQSLSEDIICILYVQFIKCTVLSGKNYSTTDIIMGIKIYCGYKDILCSINLRQNMTLSILLNLLSCVLQLMKKILPKNIWHISKHFCTYVPEKLNRNDQIQCQIISAKYNYTNYTMQQLLFLCVCRQAALTML